MSKKTLSVGQTGSNFVSDLNSNFDEIYDEISSFNEFGIIGDGVADDSDAINLALASGGNIFLPGGTYLISKTLIIPSNTRLQLASNATIYLKNGSNCHMLKNSNYAGGNTNITIMGGTWDGNGVNQTRTGGSDSWVYQGTALQFINIFGFTVRDIIIKDPNNFGIQLGNVRNFHAENVVFDYRLAGADGFHMNGLCSMGTIVGLKDPYGYLRDDFLAFNSDDAAPYNPTPGAISFIDVTGIISLHGISGIRFLDAGSGIHDINIRGFSGSFFRNAIEFGNYFQGTHDVSNIYNIHISEVELFITQDVFPLIFIATDVRNLIIDKLIRRQGDNAGFVLANTVYQPTIRLELGAVVDEFIINNVVVNDSTNTGLTAQIELIDDSEIKNLVINNWVDSYSGSGSQSTTFLKVNDGNVRAKMNNVTTVAATKISKTTGTISLKETDFFIDPVSLLTPVEGDVVLSDRTGKTKGLAYYNATNWISLIDGSVIN